MKKMVDEERADGAVLENNVVYLSKRGPKWHVTPALFCRGGEMKMYNCVVNKDV